MGEIMTLIEAIRDLESLDGDNTIYAAEPWTRNSSAIVAPEPVIGGLPPEVIKLGMKYFLEVFIARDFLEDWKSSLGIEPTLEQQCERLIKYATTDA